MVSTFVCPMISATTLAGTPLSCAHDEYVRLNVNHVDARKLPPPHMLARPTDVKTLFGEIGLPDHGGEDQLIGRPSLFVRAFHAASNRSAASGKRDRSGD